MADTVTLTTLMQTKKRLVVAVNYISDGTGVTDTVIVDKSAFTGLDGTEPGKFVVESIQYTTDGVKLRLEFEHTTDDPIAMLSGQGFLDFSSDGMYQGFVDPASAGGTGDIVMTSIDHTSGDQATIILFLRKKD